MDEPRGPAVRMPSLATIRGSCLQVESSGGPHDADLAMRLAAEVADVFVSGLQHHGELSLLSPNLVAYLQDIYSPFHVGSDEGEREELLLLDRALFVIIEITRDANTTFLHVGTHPRGLVRVRRGGPQRHAHGHP